MKQRRFETCQLNEGGSLVDGSKSGFAIVGDDASALYDRKLSNSEPEKTNGLKRKIIKRSKVLKSHGWYEKAALSIQISGKTVTNAFQDYIKVEK